MSRLVDAMLELAGAIREHTARAYPVITITKRSPAEYGVAKYGETEGEKESREYLLDLDAQSASRSKRRSQPKP